MQNKEKFSDTDPLILAEFREINSNIKIIEGVVAAILVILLIIIVTQTIIIYKHPKSIFA